MTNSTASTPVNPAGSGVLADKATGALAGAAVGDALGGAAEGNTPEAIQERYGGFIEGIVPPFLEDWRNAAPDRAVPQGRRAHHRRHADDPCAGRRVRPGARPSRRLRDRRAPRAAVGRGAPLDPRARDRNAAVASHLPRREMARRPAPLRPRRPARSGGRQHRQLRSGDVRRADRDRQRRRSRRRVRRGDRRRRRAPVELRPRGRRSVRAERRRGDAAGRVGHVGRRSRDRGGP